MEETDTEAVQADWANTLFRWKIMNSQYILQWQTVAVESEARYGNMWQIIWKNDFWCKFL